MYSLVLSVEQTYEPFNFIKQQFSIERLKYLKRPFSTMISFKVDVKKPYFSHHPSLKKRRKKMNYLNICPFLQ